MRQGGNHARGERRSWPFLVTVQGQRYTGGGPCMHACMTCCACTSTPRMRACMSSPCPAGMIWRMASQVSSTRSWPEVRNRFQGRFRFRGHFQGAGGRGLEAVPGPGFRYHGSGASPGAIPLVICGREIGSAGGPRHPPAQPASPPQLHPAVRQRGCTVLPHA